MTHKTLIAIALFVLAPALGVAQTDDPSANARVRLGPLALSPTLALVNAGVDNNVFNDPDQLTPKSDFTMTLRPATDLWLHMGRAWLTGRIQEDLVYYRTYVSERSANQSYRAGILLPLNRIRLSGNVTYLNARDRPGFEIDARAGRSEVGFNGSAEVRALAKVFVGVRGDRVKTDYDRSAVFLNTNLQFELNRTVTTGAVTMRYQLTPLTSLTLDIAREQDRFLFSRLRDSNSTRVAGGVTFDPFALIKGSATVGFIDFKPESPDLPSYRGLSAQVNLSYVALGATKIGVTASRDVAYSYEVNQPYYIQTGATASVLQQVYGPLDVVGRVGVQQLDYGDRIGVVVTHADRSDYVHTYGGGAGYRLGRDIRIGFDVDRDSRTSPVRPYQGMRYGLSITYGS